MSECRALTNVVGNGAATLVVSRWQNEHDPADLRGALSQPRPIETNSEQ
jgi:aerobic C4-dicarboxylate transport protein